MQLARRSALGDLWRDHLAWVGRPEARVATAVQLAIGAAGAGERVILVHGGGVEGTELTVMLEERGVDLQDGRIELLHRSGFASAAVAAARRTLAASPGPLRAIVLDDGVHGGGCVPCHESNQLGEPASLTCMFDSQKAALRCLPRLLVHDHVAIEGVTLALDSPADRLLVLDLLWGLLRREEEVELAVAAAMSAGLPGAVVETLARRRRSQIADRRSAAAVRGELTRTRRRAEQLEAHAATREAIQRSHRDADGDLDALLETTASMAGAFVVFEDAAFRLVRWAGPTTAVEPSSLADLLTQGRLHRLAAELEPGRVATVALGTPSAGTRLVMRLSQRTLGYLSIAQWSATDTDGATEFLRQLEGPFVAALRLERDRAMLSMDLRTHIVRLLASGTLSPSDATSAAEHAGWHRARSARMAALVSVAQSSSPIVGDLGDVCERAQLAGFPAAVHDGCVAVLLTAGPHDVERLREFVGHDDGSMAAGLGETVIEASAAAQSFRQAAWAARMAATSARRVLDFDDLGVHRLLMPGAESGDTEFEAPIRRLEEAAANLGFDAIESLTVYLDAGASPAEAGRRLHVHVNSMRYRLERISQIAGLDLADPEQRFRLQLALRIRASRLFLRSQLL